MCIFTYLKLFFPDPSLIQKLPVRLSSRLSRLTCCKDESDLVK
jgi:hypothetical protein